MTIYDMIFIINLVVLMGIAAYHCFKKDYKAIIYNIIVLLFFVSAKIIQVNYVEIREDLYEMLGPERFEALRVSLKSFLIFGSSITVSVQILCELIGLIAFAILAAQAAVIFVKSCTKGIFSNSVSSENEDSVDRFGKVKNINLYLVYERLLN